MLPLKLVRSLVLKESINPPLNSQKTSNSGEENADAGGRTPFLLFLPARELVTDTYRLATIARDIGMDLHPTPSLSHIIFTFPPASPTPSPSTTSSSSPPSSFPSSSSSLLLPSDAVPLPFPYLSSASISNLRSFAAVSKGLFKLVFVRSAQIGGETDGARNWNCCSVSLVSRINGFRIESMDGFCRALAGKGWTMFKTQKDPVSDSGQTRVGRGNAVYLFRKVDSNRVKVLRRGDADECRVRELRLPPLDFRNAPLRILQYIVLMTNDVFYLA